MYVVRLKSSYNGSFRNAVEGIQEPMEGFYLRRWERYLGYGDMVPVNGSRERAKTWKTREGAERVAARFTSDYRTFVVEEA